MDQDVAIAGIGEARVGREAGCSSWELHLEAIRAALLDACGLRRHRWIDQLPQHDRRPRATPRPAG